MSERDVAFDVADGVATVEFRRPEALNAVTTGMKAETTDRVRAYGDDPDVRAIRLRGAGGDFCAGGDITEVPESDYSLSEFTEGWADLFDALRTCGVPTVAQVEGVCLGGGFDLMLHCDFAVAAEDATLGQPESNLGIVNHFAPPLLREMVGWRRAMELVMTGDPVDGAAAAEMGLVTRSVPADDLDSEVETLLDSLTAKSPRVLRRLKRGMYESLDMPPDAAQDHLGRIAHEAVRTDPDYREGIDAQLEGRDPEWDPE